MNFSMGRCRLEFTQALSSVALAWHKARGSTPFGVTVHLQFATVLLAVFCLVLLLVFFGLEMKRAPSAFANFMTLDTQATLSIPYGKALLIQLLPDCNFLEDGNPCNSFALFNFCKFHKTRHSRHVVHSIWHCP